MVVSIGGVFIRPTIRELELRIKTETTVVRRGFIFPKGRRINARGGRFIKKGGEINLLLNGHSFGGGTPTSGIKT
ncbi:MAG: hypothetical protein U9P70_01010 [Patescibacteria group bacterium]|nr:hypothetical protein [Patescibacteria group bacterium]